LNIIMKAVVVLLCAGAAMLAASTTQAHGCSLAEIRVGFIGEGDCILDAKELLHAYDRYKARQKGLYEYEVKVVAKPVEPEEPAKPNLRPYNIKKASLAYNTVMDAAVEVTNDGNASAGPFYDVQVRVEFIKLDDNTHTVSQPVTVRMYTLAAGASERSDWIRTIRYIIIPDPDPDYTAIVTATVDPNNVIDESNETDNQYTEICRIPGLGDGQQRPLGPGEEYC
jgi:hypothetical protein